MMYVMPRNFLFNARPCIFFLADTVHQLESTDSPSPAVGTVTDRPAAAAELAPEQTTGEAEVQRDISEGIPEMSLRPQAESARQQQQQPASSSGGQGKGRLSVSKSGKPSGKGDKSKSSRRTGKKDRMSRRGHKKELIDDNQSEISYQPDTDLSRSKASKKVFTG